MLGSDLMPDELRGVDRDSPEFREAMLRLLLKLRSQGHSVQVLTISTIRAPLH